MRPLSAATPLAAASSADIGPAASPAVNPATAVRRYDIDALRVLAFALLIAFHVGMAYVADWHWHIKSPALGPTLSGALQYPMLLLNRWRMPLLFLISGAALRLLLAKTPQSPWALLRSRSRRLLIPLLFGMLVVVPIQPYCQAVANGSISPGFVHFLYRYFTFQPWPHEAFDGAKEGMTWNHLWYLPYLWVYTVLLLALRGPLQSRAGHWLERAFTGLRGGMLLLLPGLAKTLYLQTLGDAFPGTNNLYWDWYNHAWYFTVFLYGYWLAGDTAVWAELRALRWRSLGLALLCYAVYAPLLLTLDAELPGWQLLAVRWLSGLHTWLWLAAVLGWGHALLNRPWPWLRYANEAVISWYVLHQSLIVALVFVLLPLHWGAGEIVVVLFGTVTACALLHEYLIRRRPVLRWLFGLKATARQARTPATGRANTDAALS